MQELPYRAQLVVRLEGAVTQTVALTETVLRIGRLPDNDLALAMPMVSGHHAELRLDADGAALTDVGSRNGTYVNDQRLAPHQPYPLPDGATFRIFPYELTYEEISRRVEERTTESLDLEQLAAAITPEVEAAAPPTIQTDLVSALEALPPDVVPPSVMPPIEPEPLAVPALEREPVVAAVVPVPTNGAIVPDGHPLLVPLPVVREAFPLQGAPGPFSGYLQHLPVIFQGDDFLGRLLLVFESVWEPLEQRQDHSAMYFDPRTSPVSFLPWLARWLDLPIDRHWPESRIRALVAEAMHLYSWRGTRYGLTRMIEVCTGISPVITELTDEPFCFRISVRIPPDSEVDRDMVEHLILAHKPAHVGYYLDVAS